METHLCVSPPGLRPSWAILIDGGWPLHCLLIPTFPCRVVWMCKYFQESVRELSVSYYSILRRHNYVTPTSYLELILTFKALLNSKRLEIDTMRNRYLVGLQKLDFAASQVSSDHKKWPMWISVILSTIITASAPPVNWAIQRLIAYASLFSFIGGSYFLVPTLGKSLCVR